jgi:hypothetical protein
MYSVFLKILGVGQLQYSTKYILVTLVMIISQLTVKDLKHQAFSLAANFYMSVNQRDAHHFVLCLYYTVPALFPTLFQSHQAHA